MTAHLQQLTLPRTFTGFRKRRPRDRRQVRDRVLRETQRGSRGNKEVEQELRGSTRLGNYLRRLRVGYGLSLRRVEDKAKTGGGEIDNSQLSRYERGKCYPSFDKLCLLANIFNVPIQNFSDVLDLERVDPFLPAESATYEDLKAEASREWDQGNYARAYAIYE